MRRHFLAFATALLLAATAWGDYDDGWVAHERGDYETAFEEFLPLAEQGDAWPQILLGAMYYFGEGVEKDYAEAMKWYLLAAEQGHAEAKVCLWRLGLFLPGRSYNDVIRTPYPGSRE